MRAQGFHVPGRLDFGDSFDIWAAIFDAVAADPELSLIATVGPAGNPQRFGAVAANIRVEPYVPQSWLLEAADAVIAHGGYDTLMGAVRRGLPIVTIPMPAGCSTGPSFPATSPHWSATAASLAAPAGPGPYSYRFLAVEPHLRGKPHGGHRLKDQEMVIALPRATRADWRASRIVRAPRQWPRSAAGSGRGWCRRRRWRRRSSSPGCLCRPGQWCSRSSPR
jgi:hypothetical protein